jgi:anti-anti-sigma regulatory factor
VASARREVVMTEGFRAIADSAESITLRLGPRGLDDGAEELFEFVRSAVEAGHVSRIILDASGAELVTLEGIGVLLRLRAWARDADTELRVAPVHPRLERKLRETGTAGLFGAAASST